MLQRLSLCVLLSVLCVRQASAQAADHNSKEYSFFRTRFEQVNGKNKEKEMNQAFDAIAESVKEIQRTSPNVSLGAMLSLALFEGGARMGFFNTRDDENSFNPARKVPGVPTLDPNIPFSQQPLARYSYQFGIVPIHTSIFRPCLAATQHNRMLFDTIAKQEGFAPTREQLAGIKGWFDEVCHKARRPVPDQPRAVDFYVLNAHTLFGVPANRAGGETDHLADFPFYSPRLTTPFFFAAIRGSAKQDTTNRVAICSWGGSDKSYCREAKQNQILAAWDKFAGLSTAAP